MKYSMKSCCTIAALCLSGIALANKHSLPVKVVNNTGKTIYIVTAAHLNTDKKTFSQNATTPVTGKETPVTGKECVFSGANDCVLPAMLVTSGHNVTFYINNNYSGRIYFSTKPLINQPSGFLQNQTDKSVAFPQTMQSGKIVTDDDGKSSSYTGIVDKVEFTNNNDGSWVNPTSVDYFGIPISITQQIGGKKVTSGMVVPRDMVQKRISDYFDTAGYKNEDSKLWQSLDTTLGSKTTSSSNILRIQAPKSGFSYGSQSITGGWSDCTKNKPLYIDLSELPGVLSADANNSTIKPGVVSGTVDNGKLNFAISAGGKIINISFPFPKLEFKS